MRFITWDIGILASLGLLLAYSLLIRKHKALATLISVYIAYLLASAWGGSIAEFFKGDRVIFKNLFIQANATQYMVQAIFLIVVTVLISTFMKLGGKRSRYSVIEVVLYSISTLALLLMFLLSFMDPGMREHALHSSKILPYVYAWRQWILGLPIAFLIFFGIYGNDDQ